MTLYPESKQIPLMLYNGHPRQSVVDAAYNTDHYIAQLKLDGCCYQLEHTESGHVYLFSRTKSKKTGELAEKSANFPHIVEWAKKSLPRQTILIGEIYKPNGHSNDVTKISGCLPRTAIKRQFDTEEFGGPLHYYIFDCLYWEGKNLVDSPFEIRYNYIKENIENTAYIEVAQNIEKDFGAYLQKIFAKGGEGVVFKKKNAIYRPGKRSTDDYFKFKQHLDSLDVICIGLEDPVRIYSGKEIETWPYWIERKEKEQDGSYHWISAERNCYEDSLRDPQVYIPVTKPWYYNWKNSMILGVYKNGEIIQVGKVASGLTDAMREDLANNPENYLNHVVQISCMSVNSKDGTIRHPVFEQMREDKNPEDCAWEDIFQ